MQPILKQIPLYPSYYCGSDGYIYSFKNKNSTISGIPRRLKGGMSGRGYSLIALSGNGGICHKKVHILICESFHGERPIVNGEKYNCSHINDLKLDNRPENLIWESASLNQQRAFKNGNRGIVGEKRRKFNETQIFKIREQIEDGIPNAKIAKKYKCRTSIIYKIKRNLNYQGI